MMHFSDLQKKRDYIYAIAEKYGVENIRVFGSLVRDEMGKDSDIDFLVTLKRHSLFALGGFQAELEDYLTTSVDVVEEEGLHYFIAPHIMRDARPL